MPLRKGGVEPPILSELDPKSSAYANSATFAGIVKCKLSYLNVINNGNVNLLPQDKSPIPKSPFDPSASLRTGRLRMTLDWTCNGIVRVNLQVRTWAHLKMRPHYSLLCEQLTSTYNLLLLGSGSG